MRERLKYEVLLNCILIQEDVRPCFFFWCKKTLKISNFIKYMFSAEVCYSFWVQTVLENKFEAQEISNNFTITNKVLNVLHMMFCSLPQILIVCIYSSYLGRFIWIDIIFNIFITNYSNFKFFCNFSF